MGTILKFGCLGIVGFVVLIVVVVAVGSSNKPAEQSTVTGKPAEKQAASPTTSAPPIVASPTATSIPTTPTPSVPNFGEGTKLVGTDIQPGTYRSKNSGSGCYWARLSDLGGTTQGIITNDNALGSAIVTIAESDKAFTSRRCAPWLLDLSPLRSDPAAQFRDGVFMVGTDIAPGTWRTEVADGCYWARIRGFSGQTSDIIANDNARGAAVVQIVTTDKGFISRRCGNWTKIA